MLLSAFITSGRAQRSGRRIALPELPAVEYNTRPLDLGISQRITRYWPHGTPRYFVNDKVWTSVQYNPPPYRSKVFALATLGSIIVQAAGVGISSGAYISGTTVRPQNRALDTGQHAAVLSLSCTHGVTTATLDRQFIVPGGNNVGIIAITGNSEGFNGLYTVRSGGGVWPTNGSTSITWNQICPRALSSGGIVTAQFPGKLTIESLGVYPEVNVSWDEISACAGGAQNVIWNGSYGGGGTVDPDRAIVNVSNTTSRLCLEQAQREDWLEYRRPWYFVDNMPGCVPNGPAAGQVSWVSAMTHLHALRVMAESFNARVIFNLYCHLGILSRTDLHLLVAAIGDEVLCLESPWHPYIRNSAVYTEKQQEAYRTLLSAGTGILAVTTDDETQANFLSWANLWRLPTDRLYVSVSNYQNPAPYLVLAPIITGVSPNVGTHAGGTSVILRGRNFSKGTSVRFGEHESLNFHVIDDTTIMCTSPPESIGKVDIIVASRSEGTSVTWYADKFAYN